MNNSLFRATADQWSPQVAKGRDINREKWKERQGCEAHAQQNSMTYKIWGRFYFSGQTIKRGSYFIMVMGSDDDDDDDDDSNSPLCLVNSYLYFRS